MRENPEYVRQFREDFEHIQTRLQNSSTHQSQESSLRYAKWVSVLQKTIQIYNISADYVKSVLNNQAKVRKNCVKIDASRREIKLIIAHSENVRGVLMPMLDSMFKDVTDLETRIQCNSQSFLDIAKWEVQSFLRDMQMNIEKFTEGFERSKKR
jgi:hypothetical protein